MAKRETAYEYLVRTIKSAGDACLEWPHSRTQGGYGQLGVPKRCGIPTPNKAHVVALSLTAGFRPDCKQQAMHLCHNPSCFNPNHLKWGTAQENADMRRENGTAHSLEALALSEKLYFQHESILKITEMTGVQPAAFDTSFNRCADCAYVVARCGVTRARFAACQTKGQASALIKTIQNERAIVMNTIVSRVSDRRAAMSVLRDHYFTLEAIGLVYGITRERVRQITCKKYLAKIERDKVKALSAWPPVVVFLKSIDRERLASDVGCKISSVTQAVSKRKMPAHWYEAAKAQADELGLDCPPEYFNFKRRGRPVALNAFMALNSDKYAQAFEVSA